MRFLRMIFRAFIKPIIEEQIKQAVVEAFREVSLKKLEAQAKREITLADEIEYNLICSPEDLEFDKYHAKNKKLNISLWIANDESCLKVDDTDILTPKEKQRIWQAIKDVKKNIMMKSLRESENSLHAVVGANKYLSDKMKELEERLEKMQSKKLQYIGEKNVV